MRLSLSSSAAPDAALPELLSACVRRGLSGLELVAGQAHGLAAGVDSTRAATARAAARAAGVRICALHLGSLEPDEMEGTARAAAALGAPVVVPARALDTERLEVAAAVFAGAGATLLLAHGTEPAAVERLRAALDQLPDAGAVGLAWEFRPEHDDPTQLDAVLRAAGPDLQYVRLHGGGPESAQQTGRGVGAIMARLALARFTGPLVLTPSDPRYHYIWRIWLGRVGGWGCGSKQSDPSLIMLEQETITVRGHA